MYVPYCKFSRFNSNPCHNPPRPLGPLFTDGILILLTRMFRRLLSLLTTNANFHNKHHRAGSKPVLLETFNEQVRNLYYWKHLTSRFKICRGINTQDLRPEIETCSYHFLFLHALGVCRLDRRRVSESPITLNNRLI